MHPQGLREKAQQLDDVSFRLMTGSYIGALLLIVLGAAATGFSLAAYGSIGRLFALVIARAWRRFADAHERGEDNDENGAAS